MKFYISIDWEGISGVVSWEIQDDQKSPFYLETRRRMTKEANCVIEGLFEGGAKEVVVNDSHGYMTNLLIDELDPRANLIMGSPKPFSMVEGLNSEFTGVILLGYHPRAGTEKGILDHTYSSASVYELRVNGEPFSEGDLNGSYAASLGVPVIMISGDKAAVEELQKRFPKSYGVISKIAVSRTAALLYHPSKVYSELKAKAKEAALNCSSFQPIQIKTPISLEIDFITSQKAESACVLPEAERVGPRTVRINAPDMITAYRRFLVLLRI